MGIDAQDASAFEQFLIAIIGSILIERGPGEQEVH
jgi:hypothetical protein